MNRRLQKKKTKHFSSYNFEVINNPLLVPQIIGFLGKNEARLRRGETELTRKTLYYSNYSELKTELDGIFPSFHLRGLLVCLSHAHRPYY